MSSRRDLADSDLAIDGILGYREYIDFLTLVEQRPWPSELLIDLGGVGFAHPSGMAPMVATTQYLLRNGWKLTFAMPNDDEQFDYFGKAGWIAGLQDRPTPTTFSGASYVPLVSYSSSRELNALIPRILDHFSRVLAFKEGVLDALDWTICEITENVVLHAGKGAAGWVQLTSFSERNQIELVVVDTGIGLLNSLQSRLEDLTDDTAAIEQAVMKGVTRDPNVGQGNGLAGAFRIALAAKGWVNIHSGNGQLRYGQFREPPSTRWASAPLHQGTLIAITLPTNRKIDVTDALWGHAKRVPLIDFELKYLREDAAGVHIRVNEEASSLGNRESGRELRVKVINLATVYPQDPIVIDFQDIGMISASFADEFVGRMVREIGVTKFFSRFRLISMSDLVSTTIDHVVAQRLDA